MSPARAADQLAMSRRRFGALAAGGLAALALPGCSRRFPARTALCVPPLTYAAGETTPVVVAGVPRGADEAATEGAVRAAALAASDFSWLSRGDIVLIKPVCNSGNAYPATTDPIALRTMIRLLYDRGAGRVIVGDMSGVEYVRFNKDGLRGSSRALMENNGIKSAVEAAGGEIQAFEESGWEAFFEELPAARGTWLGPIMMPNVLREADHVVLMPRCGRHVLAGSTLGLKAAVGWWRHDSRLEYHRDAGTFSEKTADGNTVPSLRAKQRLVLTSATKVLTTFGPDKGYVAEPGIGLVIASPSVVAHDMVSLAWLLEERRSMPAADREGPIDDPNSSRIVVNLANRIVTHWLGGFGEMLRTQRLARYDLNSIWDDRVLYRAFQIFGGVPRVEIVDADGSVPQQLRQMLGEEIALERPSALTADERRGFLPQNSARIPRS